MKNYEPWKKLLRLRLYQMMGQEGAITKMKRETQLTIHKLKCKYYNHAIQSFANDNEVIIDSLHIEIHSRKATFTSKKSFTWN